MVSTSIHERFAAQARRTPDAVAVSAGDAQLTYRQLDERANRLAHRLIEAGVEPRDPVAVLMERSADVVVAILAALKAGAFYLPLHSAYPLPRMQQIMDRAGSPVLLTDLASEARGLPRTRQVILPAGDLATAGAPATDPGVPAGPDAPAYVIHTSGSTGEPKGVEVPHRGVLGLADDTCWDGRAHRRILALAPYAFGVSTYELWVPLLRGGEIVLPPPGDLDVRTVRRLITAHGITALHVTAGLFRLFADEAPDSFAPVHEVLTGGDVISPTAVQRVLDACPGLVVRAMYGATEVSSFAASATLTAPYEPTAVIPVGHPLDTVDARLLDEELRPVADGGIGELYIAGDRLALGYYRRPDLTAERFVEDPGAPGSRMYRTGDLMRRGSRGLEFAGRVGDQVKIRGFRVEPAEVEHVLAGQPGVAHAAVVAQEQEGGDRRLVAYLVPKTTGLDEAALRSAVAAVLPDYMVPAAFMELAELPLTANGKLDRAALPAPVPQKAVGSTPAAGARQDVLCALFSRVLGVPGVGVDDDFFTLGGESLQAVRLASRIEAELGYEISVGDVLNHPTVAELDRRMEQLAQADGLTEAAR
ncbi:amino acid adenylation domain-containing protein [Streptomyces sp. 1222.5]|uniref:non-ribosomal peptide synthetase n=1 Tax=unclassified Streptomyces TaxID=2593676 RepID=UPI00089A000E|nr:MULTISPECIES: non-ribosomal peptide synthetase [unclassified Streptomyces]PKW00336.1 amino acid adenylation domain-containing protein [Streptomyces sp. 5112.2]SED85877.1 amino acid adenylation domain-containing protein [Streptomyces sp. 1222.5]